MSRSDDQNQTIAISKPASHREITKPSQEGHIPESSWADARLQEAADRLKSKLAKKGLQQGHVDLGTAQTSSDINCLAQNVGTAIAKLMDERVIKKSRQRPVKAFIETWIKKALPYIKTGLTIGKVLVSSLSKLDGLIIRTSFQNHMGS